MKPQAIRKFLQFTVFLTLVALLTACGGGGGGSSSTGGSSSNNSAIGDNGGSTGSAGEPATGGDSSGGAGAGSPEPETFSVKLSWSIPDTRENGDPLEVYEVGGYELQYKLASDPVYTSIVINNGNEQSYEITNLIAGTYQFRMASFDTANLYSDFTDPLSAAVGS